MELVLRHRLGHLDNFLLYNRDLAMMAELMVGGDADAPAPGELLAACV